LARAGKPLRRAGIAVGHSIEDPLDAWRDAQLVKDTRQILLTLCSLRFNSWAVLREEYASCDIAGEIEGEDFARMGWGWEKTAAQKTEDVTALTGYAANRQIEAFWISPPAETT
jgi:hypothetical protein